MSEEKRIGRQTPTLSRVLPYEDTHGGEAVLLYNQSSKTPLEWQELMMYDIMAVNPDGTWKHMKFGWSVPRQNGKSELLIMRAIWGLTHGERILYTAHLVNTSHSAWEKITYMLDEMGFVENDDFKNLKNKGSEQIRHLKGKGVINFRTRTVKGGLGESYDLLIIDEAQEYTTDQEGALKYVIRASRNPQTLMCGTPPTTVSSGTVFTNYRGKILSGEGEDDGWAEWSAPFMSDTSNRELWYETNPSLGVLTTEKIMREEFGDDIVNDNIQSLGLWLLFNLKSAITKKEWESAQVEKPPKMPHEPRLSYAAKFGKDDKNLSLSVAVKLDENKIFVECIDCRPIRDGVSWILPYAKSNFQTKQTFAEIQMNKRGLETFKSELREVIDIECADLRNRTFEDVVSALFRDYGVECRVADNTISYKHPNFKDKTGRLVSVRGSKLGKKYLKGGIENVIREKNRRAVCPTALGLVAGNGESRQYAEGKSQRSDRQQGSRYTFDNGDSPCRDTAGLYAEYASRAEQAQRESDEAIERSKRVRRKRSQCDR